VPLWHERDISHSSAERVVVPDAFLALDYMLDRFRWIVDGLVVHADRMERNLWASHGLFFSHRLLLALVERGVERPVAYRLVQRNAMRAWDEELDFPQLVRDDAEVRAHLDDAALDDVFDLAATVANLDTTFDRLSRLAPKEEPVHV
jgi:adenylosuccinate lyase